MTARSLPALLLVVLAAVPVRAVAQEAAGPADHLARARVCRAALDFDCAQVELALARDGASTLADDARLELARLSAETALSLGRREQAAGFLRELLERSPGFAPGTGWPPAWHKDLEAVRATLPDRQAPDVAVQAPPQAVEGRPLEVRVRASDRSGIGRVTLHVAGRPALDVSLATTDGRTWSGSVPGDRVAAPDLALWVEAWDLAGNGPSRWGSPETPNRIPVVPPPAEAKRPVWKEWWFWTALVAGAAGAGVGIYFLARPGGGSDPGLPSGNVSVEMRWPRR